MALNIIDEYIKMIKTNITKYMKLIFEKKYNKEIFSEYLESYISSRYYNTTEDYKETQYSQKIMKYLREKRNELISQKEDKKELIENIYSFYNYILYFDYVLPCEDLEEIVNQVNDLRIKKLGLENADFKKNLKKEVEKDWKQTENFLENYVTDKFTLKMEKYPNIYNLYNVYMDYDVKFSELYDKKVIREIYDTDPDIIEEKLFVEYHLAELQVLIDIIKKNFKRKYVLEFSLKLMAKKQKMARLLKIIDNDISKEKLNIKLEYKAYNKYSKNILELIKQGFKFVVKIEEETELSTEEIQKLELFNYIIISKDSKMKKELQKNKNLKNKIIYE